MKEGLQSHSAGISCIRSLRKGALALTYEDEKSLKNPLSLPSPARGEGFETPSLDGRGKGEGDN